ncbi:MAG: hypothetical protein GY901_07300 [Actinomycetia bacterium]|nr:hypothetical protein [Actinomycetes bacterium]
MSASKPPSLPAVVLAALAALAVAAVVVGIALSGGNEQPTEPGYLDGDPIEAAVDAVITRADLADPLGVREVVDGPTFRTFHDDTPAVAALDIEAFTATAVALPGCITLDEANPCPEWSTPEPRWFTLYTWRFANTAEALASQGVLREGFGPYGPATTHPSGFDAYSSSELPGSTILMASIVDGDTVTFAAVNATAGSLVGPDAAAGVLTAFTAAG